MKFFIDTEFNEFQGELISLALVAEDGAAFYEVLNCSDPGPWVAKHVIPVLNKDPVDIVTFQRKLRDFLKQYTGQEIHIIADWPDDIRYFCQTLIVGPGMCMSTNSVIRCEINQTLSSELSEIPHNALADARAIRDNYYARV